MSRGMTTPDFLHRNRGREALKMVYSQGQIQKKQLIHPTQIENFPELTDMQSEDESFYSVTEMLAELLKRNSKGLVVEREPKERLRISCRFHSLLLASILKSNKISARVKCPEIV
jgi:hypothetical protein